MQLGETIATYDVGLALRGESGKFDVTSPSGEIYHVTCKPDHSISNLEWAGNGANPQPFLIRKVAEPVLPPEIAKTARTAATESAAQTKPAPAPFLLENQGDDLKLTNVDSAAAGKGTQESLQGQEAASLEFLYVESDPETKQPSACVYLKGGKTDPVIDGERLITSPCATFNDLDFQIRTLHAQLDEIRSRARKKFYESDAIAASA
jgi:hypothetical protein